MSHDAHTIDACPPAGRTQPVSRRVRWLGNLAMVAVSVTVGLASMEMLLKLFPEFQVQSGTGESMFCGATDKRHMAHPLYGYSEVPGNSYFERFSPLDRWNYVSINDEGFRDNYPRSGEPVFVLGDSMVRASVVDESEGFSYLLNLWQPGLSFRNYGVGGYGQANEMKLYEDKGREVPHRLVIEGVSLSTDLADNLAVAKLDGDGVAVNVVPKVDGRTPASSPLVRIHTFLFEHTLTYPLLYSLALRPFVEAKAPGQYDKSLAITRRLLERMAAEASTNGADLVLLVLPAWAEVAGLDDGTDPVRQRKMLADFAATHDGVYLVDPTREIEALGPDVSFGVIDKHLSARGHFAVATVLDRWLSEEWPRGPHTPARAHTYVPRQPTIADCTQAERYRTALTHPMRLVGDDLTQ